MNLNSPRLPELSEHLLRIPTADRGSFYTLASPSDIQEWTRAKADEYRQFTLAVLAIHNLGMRCGRSFTTMDGVWRGGIEFDDMETGWVRPIHGGSLRRYACVPTARSTSNGPIHGCENLV